jgi:DNA-binding MarR family transcriptional regulator
MESPESLVKTLMNWIEVFMRRSMRNFFLYSKQNGFSITQISAWFLIRRKGTSRDSDIGFELGITSPAASQLLERLVQQGLIVRSEDPNDRRLRQIALSQQGEVVLKEGLQARQKWLEDLVKLMSLDEQEQVFTALNIMLEKADQLEYQPTPDT